MANPNKSAHLHRRRRGQKQKHDHRQPSSSQNPSIPKRPLNSRAEAIEMHIKRLDSAKRRIRFFNTIALCVAAVCVGNNIYTLSNRRRGGRAFGWGEAFQSVQLFGTKQRRNRRWTLFENRRRNADIPQEMLQPFGSYPNILNITAQMQSEFHPVVKIPPRRTVKNAAKLEGRTGCIESKSQKRSFWPWQKRNRNKRPAHGDDSSCIVLKGKMNETYDYIIKDYTANNKDTRVLLGGGERVPQLLSTRQEALEYAKLPEQPKPFDVGRYDEDRRGMYTTSLFVEGSRKETNRRTIHVGLDIGAPIGTAVHAFEDGIIHSAGYNPDVGDYGHVIVIEHYLKNHNEITKVYALYGHLSAKSIQGKNPGQKIKRGQSIGYLGNTAENGGWTGTHVHFQLAVNPPPTHDMPGVVALADRGEALLEYVDPRYVCGELY